jgi:6-phosphogluconolactonase
VLPSAEDLAEAGAEQFREAAVEAIEARRAFRVALSGGSTPRAIHARLAAPPLRDAIDWSRVLFFFGDERCVPPDSDRSNYRMAKETLLDPLGIAREQIFRMRGEVEPKSAAAEYSKTLEATGGQVFDLVFLGMGPDGHTASLFPGTRALEARGSVAANWVPAQKEWRLTLTLSTLNAARRVVFLVGGAEKAGPATAILTRARGYRKYPAALVRPKEGSLLWLLDEGAGARL